MDNPGINITVNISSTNNTTSLFDYDYEIQLSPPLAELIPVSIAYGVTLILGLVGNGLVIFSVSRYQQMRSITNTFLLSLATADLLLVLICVPVKFAAFFSYGWRYGTFLCKTVHYIQNVSAICSVTTLTVMSMERYYAIAHPMKAMYVCTVGRARRAIIVVWILSFILAAPILEGRIHLIVGTRRKAAWCVKWFSEPILGQLYDLYMLFIILLIPVAIMTFAYVRICQELWFMTRHRMTLRNAPHLQLLSDNKTPCTIWGTINGVFFIKKLFYFVNYRELSNCNSVKSCRSPVNSAHSTPSRWNNTEKTPVLKEVKFNEDDGTKKQVVKMLVAIVIVFILCWAPILINNVLVAFSVLSELHVGYLKYMREAFHLMSYFNSCVNPVVYGFMSRNFRNTFKRALCSCVKGRQYVRKLTFRSQSSALQEKWNSTTGTHHSEIVPIDHFEMTGKSCNYRGPDPVKL